MELLEFEKITLTKDELKLLQVLSESAIESDDASTKRLIRMLSSYGLAEYRGLLNTGKVKCSITDYGAKYIRYYDSTIRRQRKLDRRDNINTALAAASFVVALIALILAA